MCIEDAVDSTDSTYFDEDAEAAQVAVDEAVAAYAEIIAGLEDPKRSEVQRANALKVSHATPLLRHRPVADTSPPNTLKVEQLKGELQIALHPPH